MTVRGMSASDVTCPRARAGVRAIRYLFRSGTDPIRYRYRSGTGLSDNKLGVPTWPRFFGTRVVQTFRARALREISEK